MTSATTRKEVVEVTEKAASTRLLDLLAGWSAYVSADEEANVRDTAVFAEDVGELYQVAGQESEAWLPMDEDGQEGAVRAFVNDRIIPLLLRGTRGRA